MSQKMTGIKYHFVFYYTLATSGCVYLLTYLLAAKNLASEYTNVFAIASFLIGATVYLLIRLVYKNDQGHDKILAKAYRLTVWLVPLTLVLVKVILFFNNLDSEIEFQSFKSFDDFRWASLFAIFIWPFVNFIILLENFLSLIHMGLLYIGLPLLVLLEIVVVVFLFVVIGKIRELKQNSIVDFSITLAILKVLAPVVIFLCVVMFGM